MNTKVELISIGDEILAGYTVNTNASWVSRKLLDVGLTVHWITTISDVESEIMEALKRANSRAGTVIVTGGLGPTPDDITKNTICRFFNTKLVQNDEVLENIKELFKSRNRDLLKSNIAQALVPEGARVVQNTRGTAPAIIMEKDDTFFCFMPGVPSEMKGMFDPHVLDMLREEKKPGKVHTHLLRTTGIAESSLLDMLQDLIDKHPDFPFAFLPRHIGVDLRFRLISNDEQKLQNWKDFIADVQDKARKYIFADYEIELQEVLLKMLKERDLTLSVAESFTGGLLSDWLTDIPGCSAVLKGSVVAYANEIKNSALGVQEETLKKHGAVSEETALEMARGIQKHFDTSCAIATTGIAGPAGGSKEKPVGLACIAACYGDKQTVRRFLFGNDRSIIKMRGAMAGLEMLRRLILGLD